MTRSGGFFIAQEKAVSELAILFPAPEVVRVQGRRVEIRPVRLCDFEAFGQAAGELIGLLADPSGAGVMTYAKRSKRLLSVIRKATSLSAWRAWRLPAPVAIELMVHVVRVNSGFFDQALVSLAEVLAGQISRNN